MDERPDYLYQPERPAFDALKAAADMVSKMDFDAMFQLGDRTHRVKDSRTGRTYKDPAAAIKDGVTQSRLVAITRDGRQVNSAPRRDKSKAQAQRKARRKNRR